MNPGLCGCGPRDLSLTLALKAVGAEAKRDSLVSARVAEWRNTFRWAGGVGAGMHCGCGRECGHLVHCGCGRERKRECGHCVDVNVDVNLDVNAGIVWT
jgi:hypothetical protein